MFFVEKEKNSSKKDDKLSLTTNGETQLVREKSIVFNKDAPRDVSKDILTANKVECTYYLSESQKNTDLLTA